MKSKPTEAPAEAVGSDDAVSYESLEVANSTETTENTPATTEDNLQKLREIQDLLVSTGGTFWSRDSSFWVILCELLLTANFDHLCVVPTWGWILIAFGLLLVLVLTCYCCCKRCCKKKKKDEKKGLKQKVDLKNVSLLGGSMKEKVQPDMEELTENMEDNESAQASEKDGDKEKKEKEEVKLGKLQYTIDYDFSKGEVLISTFPPTL